MSASTRVPDRLRWAVDLLHIEPGDRVLEIGGGPGAAAELVVQRLDAGLITGIDRSATAVRAARTRNVAGMAAHRAAFERVSLETAQLPGGSFDKVFAVNVNLFWTRTPRAELAAIKRWLAPGGLVLLVYQPPSASRVEEVVAKIVPALETAGFNVAVTRDTTSRGDPLLALSGRVGGPSDSTRPA